MSINIVSIPENMPTLSKHLQPTLTLKFVHGCVHVVSSCY